MTAPSFQSFDDARKHYAQALHHELQETSTWLEGQNSSPVEQWSAELLPKLHRWIGTGKMLLLPNVLRLANDLTQRLYAASHTDSGTQTPLLSASQCVQILRELQVELNQPHASPAINVQQTSVLLVDNQEQFSQRLLSELAQLGHTVSCCRSLKEADQWLKHTTPSLLICRHTLPDGDGFYFCRRFKQSRSGHDLEVAILSEVAGISYEIDTYATSASLQLYADHVLDHATLAARLNEQIRRRRANQDTHRVLLMDRDLQRGRQTANELTRYNLMTSVCDTPERLVETAASWKPEFIVLRTTDTALACHLAKLIRQEDRLHMVPMILLSHDNSLQARVKALECGADDMIPQSIPSKTLASLIRARLQRIRHAMLTAHRDGLTGLWNHEYFTEHLGLEVERVTRYGGTFVLAVADIDNFKHINDTYGHLTGDRALQHVANFLKSRFRRTDIIARYGGEEFAILLQQTTLKQSRHVLRSACADAVSLQLVGATQESLPIYFSMGAAEFPDHGWDSDSIFQAADEALYRAKRLGKHRVEFADPSVPLNPTAAPTSAA